MAASIDALSIAEYKRFAKSPARCQILKQRASNLADYFSIISSSMASDVQFWFRGHDQASKAAPPSRRAPMGAIGATLRVTYPTP